jgi:hypothetical protein
MRGRMPREWGQYLALWVAPRCNPSNQENSIGNAQNGLPAQHPFRKTLHKVQPERAAPEYQLPHGLLLAGVDAVDAMKRQRSEEPDPLG